MLARDFIHDALYNPQYGYFSRHAVLLPDGDRRAGAFDFPALPNERAFMVAVEERYREFEDAMQAKDEAATNKAKEEANERVREVLRPLTRKSGNETGRQEQTPGRQLESGKRTTRFIPAGSTQALDVAQRKGRMDLARQLLNEKETGEHDRDVKAMAARQVWHTPTELFKPQYAHAIARYMIERLPKGQPLRIYEVGAGSGALASDLLDYVQAEHPDLYATMTYHIIEISPRLAQQQRNTLAKHIKNGSNRLQISNKSVLDWEHIEQDPCFFLAMEVFDNLTHDVVRYSTDTLVPYQAVVSIDATGDMHELWEPVRDDKIKRYLAMLQNRPGRQTSSMPASAPAWMVYVPNFIRRFLTQAIPFYPNLTPAHYIPTGSLQLLDVLGSKFPQHQMIMSDFDALPDALEGLNAPVVQTRLNGTMIAVTRYMVHQGFFDIFFPTNFHDLRHAHATVMANSDVKALPHERTTAEIVSHRDFLKRYADVPKTTCKDGSNPMLSWYANASWFLS